MKKTYLALLRGINVSGQKKIKMTDLKKLFEDAGFTNVQTYIQSGNVIFDSKSSDLNSIKKKIGMNIKSEYRFDVETITTTNDELNYVINHNPFVKEEKDVERLYVTFLAGKPAPLNIANLKENNYLPEEYVVEGSCVYLFLPDGYGKAKLNNNFLENKLKVFATTRNWKTVNALYELSKKDSK